MQGTNIGTRRHRCSRRCDACSAPVREPARHGWARAPCRVGEQRPGEALVGTRGQNAKVLGVRIRLRPLACVRLLRAAGQGTGEGGGLGGGWAGCAHRAGHSSPVPGLGQFGMAVRLQETKLAGEYSAMAGAGSAHRLSAAQAQRHHLVPAGAAAAGGKCTYRASGRNVAGRSKVEWASGAYAPARLRGRSNSAARAGHSRLALRRDRSGSCPSR